MEQLSNIIPELFYDVLGRIIPGIIALWLWLYTFGVDPATFLATAIGKTSVLSESAVIVATVVLLLAYLIGHLISPVSSLMHSKVLARLTPSYFNVLQNVLSSNSNGYPSAPSQFYADEVKGMLREKIDDASPSQYRRITYLWYDAIRLSNPVAGTRLAKMRAEYRMVESLYVVLAITAVLQIVVGFLPGHAINWRFMAGSVIAASIATWAAVRLFRTFQWAVINHYYRLASASSIGGAKIKDDEETVTDSKQNTNVQR